MSNLDFRLKQINLLQENLQTIRRLAGWTVEELGDRIGVTKQTISNLENRKTKMSFTQYIALRSVFDCEIQENSDNGVLSKSVVLLLDSGNELSDREYQEIRNSIETIAVAALGGAQQSKLNFLFSNMIESTSLGATAEIIPSTANKKATVSTWLKQLLSGKEADDGI